MTATKKTVTFKFVVIEDAFADSVDMCNKPAGITENGNAISVLSRHDAADGWVYFEIEDIT